MCVPSVSNVLRSASTPVRSFDGANFIEDWKPRKHLSPNGKAVFITGCDTGFGNALARRLDRLGLHVFAGCLFPKGKNLIFVSCNEVLWTIVNNAGISAGGEVIWTSMNTVKKIFDVNTFGVVRVTKAFLPMLCKSQGRVITTTSFVAKCSTPGLVAYSSSKQAAQSFCDGLRLEMYRFGVKVITIEPSAHKTNFVNKEMIFDYLNKEWEETALEVKEVVPDDTLEFEKRVVMNITKFSTTYDLKRSIDQFEETVIAVNPKYSYNPGTLHSRIALWFLNIIPKPFAELFLAIVLMR
ncbi:retinol dehydrogenase 7-like [Stegodyphus dumicola]|uniref:retinol dehydrogenase 7-like n=1 Tax=Stegodyphus dumicola TaxID=202533 RepID=UPI0015A9F3A5|nr:retinol dehydrogenase 7-like [Stegodyphus dumicola]